MATHNFIKLLALPVIAIPSFSFAAMVCTNYFDDTTDQSYKYGSSNSYMNGSHGRCGLTINDTVACWNYYATTQTYPNMPTESGIKQVASGGFATCAIKSDDGVNCWMTNPHVGEMFGMANVPTGLKAKQVSVGYRHTCAVKLDSTVQCWGDNRWNEASVPTNLQAKTVVAGNTFTCAVKLDNRVQCWGYQDLAWQPPKNLRTNYLSLGHENFCAINSQDLVSCWGYTQSNPNGHVGVSINQVPPNLKAKQVDLGIYHACALKFDNTVQCWGSSHPAYGSMDVPAGLLAQQIVVTEYGGCALKFDDTVQCWGSVTGWGAGTDSSKPDMTFKHL